MPGLLTEITEIATALGTVSPSLAVALARRPPQLRNVPEPAWDRLVIASRSGEHGQAFETAFANGQAFLAAQDGLRGRVPLTVEWKGPHRPPGDDVIPADLRIDRVYLVSCKYLSKVLVNPGPPRLFDRLLVGDERTAVNWFALMAPVQFQAFYEAAASAAEAVGVSGLPDDVLALDRDQQRALREVLGGRVLPGPLQGPWSALCEAVAQQSAARWSYALGLPRARLRLLWRLLRISNASYFILGADRGAQLRVRVDSAWDWMQAYELRSFDASPRRAGQPEVGWRAVVRPRAGGDDVEVDGHVEVRWSHGRFVGPPEAKVYLDTPHLAVPGYHLLS